MKNLTLENGTETLESAVDEQRINQSFITTHFLNKSLSELELRRKICYQPDDVFRQTFMDILGESRDTYFGRKNDLSSVRNMADWKKAVPIRSYPEYQPYIAKLIDGDVNVLTRSEPYALLRTSGSTGNPKLIPTTRHWRDAYRGRALYSQWGLYFEKLGPQRALGASVLDLSWERAPLSVNLDLRHQYPISQRPAAVSKGDWLPPWYHESWFRGVEAEDYRDSLYRKLRLLAGSDVAAIVALNPSKIIGLAELLAESSAELIEDIAHGTLRGRRRVADPNPALADSLLAIAKTSANGLKLSDYWPGLGLTVAWNSASAGLYRRWLDDVTPGLQRLPFSSTGTEGIITIPIDDHPSAGPLAVDMGLYEFVPVPETDDGGSLAPDAQTLDFNELEVGTTYNIVISQASGLYRYDLGDRYTVIDKVGQLPRLEFAERAGFGSSFTGEKLTEEDIHAAVRTAVGETFSARQLFTCVPVWGTPPGYTVILEWDSAAGVSAQTMAERIEIQLQRLNIEYAEKRRTHRLTTISLFTVKPGTFARVEEQRRQAGASASQLKHYWIQRNDDLLKQLQATDMRSWVVS